MSRTPPPLAGREAADRPRRALDASGSGSPPGPAPRPARTALLVLTSFLVPLVLAEAVLRLAGFRYELRLHMVESTAPAPQEIPDDFVVDRDLAWVPKDYSERLRKALAEHPDLVYMGDSCTQLGWYDEYFQEIVESQNPGSTVRSANLASAGWTTHQGLRQMQRDITRVRPKVATIYYGWNDHWLSIGIDDAEVARINASPLFRGRRLRLVQFLTKAWVGVRIRQHPQRPVRVPPQQFRDNLVQMVRAARAAGITPVLLTAPSAHEIGHEPQYLEGRWIRSRSDLVPLHGRYVQIVREVAQQENVPLCDLVAEFATLPRDVVRLDLFNEDGIHLTDDGNRALAAALYGCFEKLGLMDAVRRPKQAPAEAGAQKAVGDGR